MALYRCAACGSPNVVTDTQAEGVEYNYLKGAVGTVVLGAGGAAAGIGSKQQRVFKCPDCGLTLTYSMPQEMKNLIDLGVDNLDARENLSIDGAKVYWEFLQKCYKNIGAGKADEELAKKQSVDNEKKQTAEANLEAIIEKVNSQMNRTFNPEEQKMWELVNGERFQACSQEIELAKTENSKLLEKIEEEMTANFIKELEEYSKKLKVFTEEKRELSAKRSSLGLLKGAEKKQIDARNAEIDKAYFELKAKKDENYTQEKMLGAIVEAKKEELAKLSQVVFNIKKAYNISVSPKEMADKKDKLNQNIMAAKSNGTGPTELIKDCISLVFDCIEEISVTDLTVVLSKCYGIETIEQRVSKYGRDLISDGYAAKFEQRDGLRLFVLS